MAKKLAQCLGVISLVTVCAAALAAPKVVSGRLVTAGGFTLYFFDNDVPGSGKSVCIAACANVFPPYVARKGEVAKEPWSLISRGDEVQQWAHKGRPLYRFYADDKKGAAGGDGMNRNTWHIARP